VKNNSNAVLGIQRDFYAIQRYKDIFKQTSIPIDSNEKWRGIKNDVVQSKQLQLQDLKQLARSGKPVLEVKFLYHHIHLHLTPTYKYKCSGKNGYN
jgi:hypothetical protein